MDNRALEHYLNQLLSVESFQDYAPNGLQVQGCKPVRNVVLGVTASQQLIDAAIAQHADAMIVHHGYFWKGEPPTITGMKYQRLKKLLAHDINLYAYHLPLDAHPTLGNNAQLAKQLGIDHASATPVDDLLWIGDLESIPVQIFAKRIFQRLEREPLVISGSDRCINRLAWCTGAAQNYLEQAVEFGVDAFVSGEVSEKTYHEAKEYQIHYIAAGHHATERGGVMALSAYLNKHTDLHCQFIDCHNPV